MHAIKQAQKTMKKDHGYPFGKAEWGCLVCLWRLRNDLVHANISRDPKSNETLPAVQNRRAGYARDVVKAFVKALNAWAGTTLPDYL